MATAGAVGRRQTRPGAPNWRVGTATENRGAAGDGGRSTGCPRRWPGRAV